MTFRISKEEKNDEIIPAIHFFNAIPNHRFVEVISSLANGIGYTVEYCSCTFPDDLDPWDESFEGVQFINSALDLESVLEYPTVQELLLKSCRSFLREYPEHRDTINQLLLKFSQKFKTQFEEI